MGLMLFFRSTWNVRSTSRWSCAFTRWTHDPPDQRFSTWSNIHLNETIINYNGWDLSTQMISDLIVIARSRSDDHHKTPIWLKGRTIAIVHRDDLSIQWSTIHFVLLRTVLRDEKNRSRFFTKFSMFRESFRVPFVSLCS